jgi:hypothetical protein
LTLAEKILGTIAIAVLVGWVAQWASAEHGFQLFKVWFETLSFCGALLIVVFVGLKLLGKQPLPAAIERQVIPIASLIPVAGFLIESVQTPYRFLTVGGSLALAYFSVTTYWRRHIPEFATRPLSGGDTPSPVVPASDPPPAHDPTPHSDAPAAPPAA